MHNECRDAYDVGCDYDDGFMPGEGEMPERVKAIFQEHCAKLLTQLDGIIKECAGAQGQQMATT